MQRAKGVFYEEYPASYRFGTFIKQKEVEKTGIDARGKPYRVIRKENVFVSQNLAMWDLKSQAEQVEWIVRRTLGLQSDIA